MKYFLYVSMCQALTFLNNKNEKIAEFEFDILDDLSNLTIFL